MEEVLLLFDGPHVAYSPTTIQLYDELSKRYAVTLVAQDPNNYNGQRLPDRHVLYYRYYGVASRYIYLALFLVLQCFSKRARTFKKNGLTYRDYFFKFGFIHQLLRRKDYKTVICIDHANLYFCSLLGRHVDFLSLELCHNEHLFRLADQSVIDAVIIQSRERYEYLFGDKEQKVFYIQNAPVFKGPGEKGENKGLIYTGAACAAFGFYYCLDYLQANPEERLTVQGALLAMDKERVDGDYANLLEQKRLVINSGYLDSSEIEAFLSAYEIGFCFYNFEEPLIKNNYTNYATAPAGKLFKYLAAGVPVICNNIPGFSFVESFQCGVLLDTFDAAAIGAAIARIRSRYAFYVANTAAAAAHFSFDRAVAPYLLYLGSK